MRKRLVLPGAFVLLLAFMLAWSPGAKAYNLEGGRWNNQPSSGCCAHFYLYYYYSLQSYDRTAFDNGRYAWNQSTANVFWYTTTTDSTIVGDDEYNSSVSWVGLTTLYPCQSCSPYTEATIDLNEYYTQNFEVQQNQEVVAHELGHVMGLAHVSGCHLMNTNTTYAYQTCLIDTPTQDDINGVNSLY